MNRSNPPGHEKWLLDRLVEAYNHNPDADIVDGLQHALDVLDRQFGEEDV